MSERGVEEGFLRKEPGKVILKRVWDRIPLGVGEKVVVDRGKGGERGLDLFTVNKHDSGTGKVVLTKPVDRGTEQKEFDEKRLKDLNNPVKMAREWFDYYYKTTGSNVVRDPAAIDSRLMTAEEFMANLSGINYPKREVWSQIVEKFRENLAKARVYEANMGLKQKMELLADYRHLDHFELPRGKGLDAGRRIIIVRASDKRPGLVFQGRTYARSEASVPKLSDDELWRSYMQVEVEDIPRMVEILSEMGEKWAVAGGVVDFKFLIATWPRGQDVYRVGEFSSLSDEEPRIAMYFPDREKRIEFLRKLVSEYGEDMLSMARKREGKHRRPGTSVMYDSKTGNEFRHISINDRPGHSSDVVSDLRDWRAHVRGSFTTSI